MPALIVGIQSLTIRPEQVASEHRGSWEGYPPTLTGIADCTLQRASQTERRTQQSRGSQENALAHLALNHFLLTWNQPASDRKEGQ